MSEATLHADELKTVSSKDMLRLRFPNALERRYREYLLDELRYTPWLLLGALLMLLIQNVVDHDVMRRDVYAAVTRVRYETTMPICLLWLVACLCQPLRRFMPVISLTFSFLLGTSLFYMQYLAWEMGVERAYQTLLIGMLFFQFVNSFASWRSRCIVGFVLLAEYVAMEVLLQRDISVSVRHIAYMSCAWLTGAACSYLLEYTTRTVFLTGQRRQMLADTDPLTELPNRRVLDHRFSRLWRQAMRERKNVAIAMIDVDHFKAFNDHYGHVAGDAVLQQVADSLQRMMARPLDFVARYGGEEFTVVWYDVEPETLQDLGQDLCRAIELLNIPHAKSQYRKVTISVGLAWQTPERGDRPEHLLVAADQALYAAKENDRGHACLHGEVKTAEKSAVTAHVDDVPQRPIGTDEDLQENHRLPWLAAFSAAKLSPAQTEQFRRYCIEQDIVRIRWVGVLGFMIMTMVVVLNYLTNPSEEVLFVCFLHLAITGVVLSIALLCSFMQRLMRWMHLIVAVSSFAMVFSCNIVHWYGWQRGMPFLYESALIATLLVYFVGGQSLRSAMIVNMLNTAGFIFVVQSTEPTFFSPEVAIACIMGANVFGVLAAWMQEQKTVAAFIACQDIERLSRSDELTGLYNRRAMFENLAQVFDEAIVEEKGVAVVLLDIDYFKRYNDHYGHGGGDTVLAAVGKVLSQQVRRGFDFAARYGGEEFVLLWYGVTPQAAAQLAEQTRAAVEALNIPHEVSPMNRLTISLGVAWGAPSEGLGGERALLSHADKALYRAKEKGRNRVEMAPYLFKPKLVSAAKRNAAAA